LPLHESTPLPSRSASAARVAGILAISIVAIGILGIHVGLLRPLTGFYLFALGALVGGLVALTLSVFGIVATREGSLKTGRAKALVGGCIGAALIGGTLSAASSGRGVPSINDITTNLQDPPGFTTASNLPENLGRDMSYPNEFVAQVQQSYPDLSPIRLDLPAQAGYERALGAARSVGWEITYQDSEAGLFEARSVSRVFRFVDDIAVRVRPSGSGSIVDLRSKSRDGRGDLGANADRIRRFAHDFQDLPAVAAGPED
jgi:uncharacterized protein (DUF1499 family)